MVVMVYQVFATLLAYIHFLKVVLRRALINNALFIKTQAVKLMLDTTGCVALLRQSTHLYFPQV